MLTVSVTTLRTGVLRDPPAESIEVGESIGWGAAVAAGGRGEAGGANEGMTGDSIGGGGGVRGRLPGPDLAAGALGTGVLTSAFGTTLLITLGIDRRRTVRAKTEQSCGL